MTSRAYIAPGVVLCTATITYWVCRYHGVPVRDVMARGRHRVLVDPRMQSVFISEYVTRRSARSLGREFGGRDHSTVNHYRLTVVDLYDTNTEYRREMVRMCATMGMDEDKVRSMIESRRRMIRQGRRK